MPSDSTRRRSGRRTKTVSFTTKRWPTRLQRGSTRRVGLRRSLIHYLRNARYCYLRWGADGKVRQLDDLYPHLREETRVPGPKSTIGESVEHLDLATVIKISQAVSGEIVPEKLIDTLMRMAIEHAGAVRGLLILPRADKLRIEAEATTSGDTVIVRLGEAGVIAADLPDSIVHFVARTHENVILGDASAQNPFSADPYFRQCHARSVLCLPLLKQAKLIGLLYLENNLTLHVFTPARLAVLKMLASDAAISLENTRLYGELAEREARIRRLVEANIMGIVIWNVDGRLIDANEAFLHLVDYSHEDLVSSSMRWTDLTPLEWRDRDERALAEIKVAGAFAPYEKEYFRRDGSRVPVLIGGAIFHENGNEGVAFVLDLTERKQAEDALRHAQAELAHVARVTTMGELAASIAHEINQPLSGIITNASTCLRMLAADPPNLDGARETALRTIRDGNRASDVIKRCALSSAKGRPLPNR
jgi:PAS domain S-box-containing protein